MMAQYTITGYDASAHMSEETHERLASARGRASCMSVVVSVVFGFILLVAITFAIPDTQTPSQSQLRPTSSTYIWQTSMSTHWAESCSSSSSRRSSSASTACVTSASRMMFAFSRDARGPGPQAWRKVARHRVPVASVAAVGVSPASC